MTGVDRRCCPRTRPLAKLTKVLFFCQLDILCNEEILGKDHTLKFVVVTRWRFKVGPCHDMFRLGFTASLRL